MARATRSSLGGPAKRTKASYKESDSDASSVVVISDDDSSDAFAPSPAASSAGASSAAVSSASSPVVISEEEDPEPVRGTKRKRAVGRKGVVKVEDIEDCAASVSRPHGRGYHGIEGVVGVQDELLGWFERVREERGMPWRKRYDRGLSIEDKGQRAYEIWVSEVMLQQTQVATVIAYWTRWIQRWPTIADLAKADIEDVNAAWRGLGYYRRAKSLLEGAKTVMRSKKYNGRLPDDPDVLEKDIPGVGRYTAGAICSMAYGIRTPIVDGNIHRVLTRLLAVHAPQTAPPTIRFLWDTAEALVDALPKGLSRGIAGDWNQALMELGATVCKPTSPDCSACPVKAACKAVAELSAPPPDTTPACDLCAPIPAPEGTPAISSVTVLPMRKEKKASRVEHEVVCITEWRGAGSDPRWLLVKRPEKGLLAGLFEPPTTPIPADLGAAEALVAGRAALESHLAAPLDDGAVSSHTPAVAVPHIFSHINMTYHVQRLVLRTPGSAPPEVREDGVQRAWLDAAGVEAANVGTGVKKVWGAVYGGWGEFGSPVKAAKGGKGGGKKGKAKAVNGGKGVQTTLFASMAVKTE